MHKYYVALVTYYYREMYLVTLNKDLSLIDFILFHHTNDVWLIPIQRKPLIYKKRESGVNSTCNEFGTFTQTVWSKTTNIGTMAELESSRHVRRLNIDSNGIIRPFED